MKTDRRVRYAALALLLVFFAQTIGAGPHLSLTADEPVHLAQGYVYWKRGDFRLQRPVAQPPLPDLLPGFFLALQPGPQPEGLRGWEEADLSRFSRAFVAWYGTALPSATFAARTPITLIALIGAAFVFRWAKETFGSIGGLLALLFCAFDPNLIAHAGLATTDVLLAVWSFIAVYAAQKWARTKGHYGWDILTGAALGLALGSKTSGFFAIGIVGLLFASYALEEAYQPEDHAVKFQVILQWAGRMLEVSLIALIVLWALYRFEFRPFPGTPIPVPFTTHWIIWDELRMHLQEGHIAYLLGEISYTGWWYYYPLAFLLKTPLPMICMLIAALLLAAFSTRPKKWWQQRALWIVPLLYSGAAITSTIDIGYRYLLVMLPFLYVLCGALGRHLQRQWQKYTLVLGASWLIVGTVFTFPNYLSFFNELVRPQDSHHYLVDSNLDWGQGFVALQKWLKSQTIQAPLYLSHYTYTDPALYGLDYTPISPAHHAPALLQNRFNPDPGLYAISATTLQGVMVTDPNTYDWFRHREPLARPGNAIFVYHVVSPDQEAGWVAQCTVPYAPLTSEQIQTGFGTQGLRQLAFDCTNSWVYPGGVNRSGWYALTKETATDANAFTQAQLTGAQLSYEERYTNPSKQFSLYEQTKPPTSPLFPIEGALEIESLRFLGYSITKDTGKPGESFEVTTSWEVLTLPERPLSIMLHLIGPDGTHVSVGDGLGFPVDAWQIGDQFIQRHPLTIPIDAEEGSYTLNTGVYWLDTLNRWEIQQDGETLGDQLPLSFTLNVEK